MVLRGHWSHWGTARSCQCSLPPGDRGTEHRSDAPDSWGAGVAALGKANPTFMRPVAVKVSTLKLFIGSLQAVWVYEAAELLPEIAHHIHTNTLISEILKLKATGYECWWRSIVLRSPAVLLSRTPLQGTCTCRPALHFYPAGLAVVWPLPSQGPVSLFFYAFLLWPLWLSSACPWVVCLDPLCAVSSHLKQPGGSSQSFPLSCLRSATIQSRCFHNSPLPVLSSSRFHTPRSRLSCHRLHPSASAPCMALVSEYRAEVSHLWCL